MNKPLLKHFLVSVTAIVALAFAGCADKKETAQEQEQAQPGRQQEQTAKDGMQEETITAEGQKTAVTREGPLEIPAFNQPTLNEKGQVREDVLKVASGDVLIEDVYFAFDQSELRPGAKQTIRELADLMKQYDDVSVIIEGHCDERGTESYNYKLGQRRANAAATYLQSLGISKSRIRQVSYGELYPKDPRSTEEAWEKNRRAHFALVKGPAG